MNIKISNLGIIKEVSFDLEKKLSILCGPNNTGKTYLSYVIYSLCKQIHYNGIKFDTMPTFDEDNKCTLELDIKKVLEVINYTVDRCKGDFDSLFGISEEQAKSMFSKTIVQAIYNVEELEPRLFTMEAEEVIYINDSKYKLTKNSETLTVQIELVKSDKPESGLFWGHYLVWYVYRFFAFYPLRGVFISPVERNSIFTFSKELSISRNNIIDQLQKGGDINPIDFIMKSTNRYPLAIADGLKISNDLVNLQKNRSPYYELAESIESELLNGKLSVTDKEELVFISNKSKNKKLPIHMTASIVKTLSSLIFYLKHQASSGDLIIIDEPEMNLHPDNQIVLTRLFARLMRHKFRLLISTHSDYIIREFNNLIMLNQMDIEDAEVIKGLGYSETEKINAADVSCYYFRFKNSSSRMVEVEKVIVASDGVTIPTVDETIEKQNKISEELLYLSMDK